MKGRGIGTACTSNTLSRAQGRVPRTCWAATYHSSVRGGKSNPCRGIAMGQQAQSVHHQPLSTWIRRASERRELLSIKQCDYHYGFAAKQKNTVINRSDRLHRAACGARRGCGPVASLGIKSLSSCLTPLLHRDGPACHSADCNSPTRRITLSDR